MNALTGAVKAWAKEFKGRETEALTDAGFQQVLSYVKIIPQRGFLTECVRFWDPVHHVFAFPEGEICPWPEEFTVLGGWRLTQQPVVPDFGSGWVRECRDFLGLSEGEARNIVDGERVDLCGLADLFRNTHDPPRATVYLRRVFGLIMLHLYCLEGYLESPSCHGQAKIIRIVEQMEQNRNPASIILAETIRGLDACEANPDGLLTGSTRILQVWLMERLGLLERPKDPRTYRVRSLCNRVHRFILGKGADYWRDMLTTGAGSHIRWFLPWLRLSSFTGLPDNDGMRYVALLGLERPVYIYPDRVLRQFGRQQIVPTTEASRGPEFSITQARWRSWLHSWNCRTIWHLLEPCASTWVSPSYVKWTKEASVEVRRTLIEDDAADWKARGEALRNRKHYTKLNRPDAGHGARVRRSNVWRRLSTSEGTRSSINDRLGPRLNVRDRLGPREENQVPPKKRARMIMDQTEFRRRESRG